MTCEEQIRELRAELLSERDACEVSRVELANRIMTLDQVISRLDLILTDVGEQASAPEVPKRRPLQKMLAADLLHAPTGISFASLCVDHPDIDSRDILRTLNRMQTTGKADFTDGAWHFRWPENSGG